MTNYKTQIVYIVILLLLFTVLIGCARTVTERVSFGSEITFDINFRGEMDIGNNKYFIVISTDEAYQIPFTPYEFIEPGIPPTNPSTIDELYQYYGTWSGYILVDAGIIYLVSGPFISTTEAYAHTQIGTVTEISEKLAFSFSVDKLFPGSLPSSIYFDFVTVDASKFLKDHLTPPSEYISIYQNVIVTGSDEQDLSIDQSLDILDWVVTIQ